MESQYQKWVTLSFGLSAGLLGYLFWAALGSLIAFYDLESRVRDVGLIGRASALGVGVLAFVIIYRNRALTQLMHEVVAELARVSWPLPRETLRTTWVVIFMVVISGLILGILDFIWVQLLKWVL